VGSAAQGGRAVAEEPLELRSGCLRVGKDAFRVLEAPAGVHFDAGVHFERREEVVPRAEEPDGVAARKPSTLFTLIHQLLLQSDPNLAAVSETVLLHPSRPVELALLA